MVSHPRYLYKLYLANQLSNTTNLYKITHANVKCLYMFFV